MCFVWIWEQTAIISLYSINWLVFITETVCLLRGTDWVFIRIQVNFSLWMVKRRKYLNHLSDYQLLTRTTLYSCSPLAVSLTNTWAARNWQFPFPPQNPVHKASARYSLLSQARLSSSCCHWLQAPLTVAAAEAAAAAVAAAAVAVAAVVALLWRPCYGIPANKQTKRHMMHCTHWPVNRKADTARTYTTVSV